MKQGFKKTKLKLVLLFALFVCTLLGIIIFLVNEKGDEISAIVDTNVKQYQIKGIDISHHNACPHWFQLEQEGIHFAYLKATEGSQHEDRNYLVNYQEGKKTKIRIGTYHFYIFAESGLEQARHFIKKAKCQSGDLIPAIDVEHNRSNSNEGDKSFIAKVVKELKVLEEELYNHYGVHPVIYTDKTCYKLYIERHFTNNPLWIADLDGEPTAEIPDWKIWQYTHKGKLKGVEGNVDLNYYRYSISDLSELILP